MLLLLQKLYLPPAHHKDRHRYRRGNVVVAEWRTVFRDHPPHAAAAFAAAASALVRARLVFGVGRASTDNGPRKNA